MPVPAIVWTLSFVAVVAALAAARWILARRPVQSRRFVVGWLAVCVGTALVFAVTVGITAGFDRALEFLGEYAMEAVFAIDTLLAFIVVLNYLKIPVANHPVAALYGVAGTMVVRTVFAAGVGAVLQRLFWVMFGIGLLLIYGAWQLTPRGEGEGADAQPASLRRARLLMRYASRILPRAVSRRLSYLPPMLLATFALTLADPFAWPDTGHVYLILVANVLALLAVPGLVHRSERISNVIGYLPLGAAVIGGFVAVKIILQAMTVNSLPFVNGGEPIPGVPSIQPGLITVVVTAVIIVTMTASLIYTRRQRPGTKSTTLGD